MPAASVYEAILDAVQTTVVGLALPGVVSGAVAVRKLSRTQGLAVPCVVVSPITDTRQAVSNLRDDCGYQVQLTLVQASNKDLSANLSRLLEWRQKVERAFRPNGSNPVLAGVAEVYNATVQPGFIVSPPQFDAQHDVEGIALTFFTREPRTN